MGAEPGALSRAADNLLSPHGRGWRAGVIAVANWLDQLIEVRRQRSQLAALDQYMLKDIGLTRADVDAELSRPFWDVLDRRR